MAASLLRGPPRILSRQYRTFTTIPTCPHPTLPHARNPAADLDIDRKLPLSGSIPAHHSHVIIPTGRTDWSSRIEEDTIGVETAAIKSLKDMLGPKGQFSNVKPFMGTV